jgi:CspA family cold shock protein
LDLNNIKAVHILEYNRMSSIDSSSSEKFTGRVKWFNNKAGYGFVTVTDGSKSGSDVFIHHSAIKVDAEQYKYLVQGEYVEFTLSTVEGGKHEFQAAEVCGIKGGKLMCETRNELKTARTTYKSVGQESQDDDEPSSPRPVSRQQSVRVPRATRPPLERRAPRPASSDGEWTAVVSRKSSVRPATKGKPFVEKK